MPTVGSCKFVKSEMMSIFNLFQSSPPKSLFKNKASKKTKIAPSEEMVSTTCHIPVLEQMVVMCSESVCAPAHGREKSAGAGAGCQCPCHSVGWWLGIEGVHFLSLSATVCRHGGGCRQLQGSPHHSVRHHMYLIPEEKDLPAAPCHPSPPTGHSSGRRCHT